jgi:amino acid adenylation domain-containing protein
LGFALSEEETTHLRDTARAAQATLYMVILAVFSLLLSKLSGQDDIIVGTPAAARRHADLGHIIGAFINTLVMRNYPQGHKTFKEFLNEVKTCALDAYDNQEYPFEELVNKAPIKRDMSRNPLFDVMFIFHNEMEYTKIPRQKTFDIKVKPYKYEKRSSQFDLALIAREGDNRLGFTIEYCTKLFKEETIRRYAGCFKRACTSVTAQPGTRISAIEILEEEEKHRLLVLFNDTAAPYPGGKTVHQLFVQQVERTPDYIALHGCMDAWMHEASHITYRELNDKTDQLAQRLIEKGIQPDTTAGIIVERSIEMVIGILGILKAGGAYLPIDPEYPQERIDYMLKDSNAGVLLTTPRLSGKFEKLSIVNCQLLMVNEKPPDCRRLNIPPKEANSINNYQLTINNLQLEKSNLAYIIYTSGSTGSPKGVTVARRSVVNLLWALQQAYPFTPGDTYLLKTSYTFDVSVTELFGWYMEGGRLAILEINGEKDPAAIIKAIEREQVTHINFVPSMFRMFVDELSHPKISKVSTLRYIFLAGEALLPEMVNQFRQLNTNIALENIYGPTEAAVYSSRYSLSAWDGKGSIPIGKPLRNTRLYILDRGNRLQPVGIAGELCIAGIGVARGYLNRPELTAEKFDHDLWKEKKKKAPGKKNYNYRSYISHKFHLYRTGDLARWLPDGTIEYHGRLDHQVKIRGFRIELGEIESTLKAYIKDAVVIEAQKKNRDKYLTAYIVSGEDITVTQLREYLSQRLPDYMIPSNFVKIERVPLTPGGKVDRQALLDYDGVQLKLAATYVAPATHIEKIMVETWKNVLGLDDVGIHDNFFHLGGTSFDMIKINSILEKELEKKLPVIKMFKYPTIRSLADYLSQGENKQDRALEEEKISKKIDKGKNRLKERTRRGAENARKKQ